MALEDARFRAYRAEHKDSDAIRLAAAARVYRP